MHGNRSSTGRGGGRASAALPLLDDVSTSPASRRLASARPALAPKCQLILARTLSFGGLRRFADSPLPNDYLASRSCFALARHPERIGNFIFTIKEKITRKFAQRM